MLLCNGFGDVDNGCRYAELALEISRRYFAREWATRTVCGAYGFCLVWKRPLEDLLTPLLEGHETGLATGDIEVRNGHENEGQV
jgi:predicted ATPase